MSNLIKCKGCGQEVSPDAKACPKCGAPIKKKTGCLMMIVYGFAGLIALAIIGSILSGGGSNKTGGDSSGGAASSSPQATSSAESVKQKIKIGDEIVFDDSKWTVLSAEDLGSTLKGLLDESKKTEGRFIKVKYTVTNTTKEEDSVLETPQLLTSDGAKYKQLDDVGMYLADGEKEMMMEQLPSRIKKSFSAIFEVPKDAAGLRFQARSLAAFSTKYVEVDLGL
jgi:hypothetical protein